MLDLNPFVLIANSRFRIIEEFSICRNISYLGAAGTFFDDFMILVGISKYRNTECLILQIRQ